MNTKLVKSFLASLIVSPLLAAIQSAPKCPVNAEFVFDPVISDEFDGAELDSTRWEDWVASFQGRRQGFLFARDNIAVTNGNLELTARLLREDEKTVENLRRGFDTYATAIVKARRKSFYGYYECRAKSMHAAVCNAFWLYDPLSDKPEKKYRPGDFSEEIDIFEVFGKKGTRNIDCERVCFQTVHRFNTPYLEAIVNGNLVDLPKRAGTRKMNFDFYEDFHTYGFLWTEKELKWYVDGVETFSRPNDVFHRPMHITFDCEIMYSWIGEPDKADLPQKFTVEYFRHWKADK